MPGVEEHDLGARVVPLEGVGPGREKERIGFAPHGERRWPVGTEILLELGIELDVARVVDGTGKFLIPGLWDMHGHLTDATETALSQLIMNGVTGLKMPTRR